MRTQIFSRNLYIRLFRILRKKNYDFCYIILLQLQHLCNIRNSHMLL